MSRILSSEMLQDTQARETGEAYLILLTLSHSTLANPIRITSDGVNTPHDGNTYIPFPFRFEAPADTDSGDTRATIEIDNVDRSIIEIIRTIQSPPQITVKVVRGSNPEQLEVEWPNFELVNVDYDVFVVSGTIGQESFVLEPYPKDTFNQGTTPAIF